MTEKEFSDYMYSSISKLKGLAYWSYEYRAAVNKLKAAQLYKHSLPNYNHVEGYL